MLGRIGNTERSKPTLKRANPAGTCSRLGCSGRLRKADAGFYGKYCNPCSRKLIDHGAFDSKVPTLTQEPYMTLYQVIREVGLELLREQNALMGGQAASLERARLHSDQEKMGDPLLARRSDIWLLHHYYHHQLVTKECDHIDWLLHMTAVVGVIQLHPNGFASDDQEALFICKRGLGYRSLPSVRLKRNGTPAEHGRFALRSARMLAKKVKSDWVLMPRMQELVAERLLGRIGDALVS
jgi:hypothetical protein